MIFYYDRISLKEVIDTETYEHRDDFVNESVSKNVMAAAYFFIIKTILTVKKELTIDVIKSY